MFPTRHHETNGSQATGQFLSGINRRERMRMKPRGARCGRHEHDDGPYEAVKHAPTEARRMPLCNRRLMADFSGFAGCSDYYFGVVETTLSFGSDEACRAAMGR